MTSPIKVIAFDLDDTLLDTSRLLIPHAWELGIEAMLTEGLNSTKEACLKVRSDVLKHHHDTNEIFRQIAMKVDPRSLQDLSYLEKLIMVAKAAFEKPEVPSNLPLQSGVKELLERLNKNYKLFIVTQGDPETQKQKIKSLGIKNYFYKIFVLSSADISITKENCFQEIINTENIKPEQMLSVGNRLDNEIRFAKKLGAKTCYIQYGEHSQAKPKDILEVSDFSTPNLLEIERVCGL